MQKPVEPKKILCIHDLSGVGRCSLAVILPVLSVMGFQPVALPTVVLSTHTGGLGTPARLDGSAYGMAALEHYQELGLQFDCIYTGYLGGEAQVALAEKAFALWPAAYKVVDPVMGDNGKPYSTVTPALVERIRSLCRAADLILPNYTEAQLLLQQQPVTEQLDDAAAHYPKRPALIFQNTRLSYKALHEAAERFAGALRRAGIQPGQRVAVMLPNIPQTVIAFWGIMKAGAVAVMTNPLYMERELLQNLNDAGAECLVLLDMLWPRVAPLRDRLPVKTSFTGDDDIGILHILP